MENEVKKLKEIGIKRMFFYEGECIPTFELEDGTIKRAYFLGDPRGIKTVWYSDVEYELAKIRATEQVKKKNDTKIVDINGKQLKGN